MPCAMPRALSPIPLPTTLHRFAFSLPAYYVRFTVYRVRISKALKPCVCSVVCSLLSVDDEVVHVKPYGCVRYAYGKSAIRGIRA